MSVLLTAVMAHAAPTLAELEANADRFAQDYGAATTWADACEQAADWDCAARAWAQAWELSDNQGTLQALILAEVNAGSYGDAARHAAELTTRWPDDPWSWMLKGWAWRFRPSAWAREVARAAYRRAAKLGEGEAWCALGWLDGEAGDTWSARKRFAHGTETCARRGFRGHPGVDSKWGRVALAGAGWFGDSSNMAGGGSLTVQGGASRGGLGMEMTGRVGLYEPRDHLARLWQPEVWLQGWASTAHGGGSLTVAHIADAGWTAARNTVFGGSAWLRAGLVVRAEGAFVLTESANKAQAGLGVVIPTVDAVDLHLGAQGTSRLGESSAFSGRAGITLRWRQTTVDLGGSWGREIEPIRLSLASIWNTESALGGSIYGAVRAPLADDWTLDARVDAVHFPDDAHWMVFAGVGLSWRQARQRR